MRNLSYPGKLSPDRGDFVETEGGAIGLYIGTSARGVHHFHYPDRAQVTYQSACETFDARNPAPDPPPFDHTAFIIASEAGELGMEDYIRGCAALVREGIYLHLQGSWQREIFGWMRQDLYTHRGVIDETRLADFLERI